MAVELDHIFICTDVGAPEAEKLIEFGLREGPSNVHPGQGTACRRFFFVNGMIELLWAADADEARSERTLPTLLWERWSGRHSGSSPFGICLRPADPATPQAPFPVWDYRPEYLPAPLAMQISEAGVDEPMWVHLSFLRRAFHEDRVVEHPCGLREITGLSLTSPEPLRSAAARVLIGSGVVAHQVGPEHLLQLEFNEGRRSQFLDFRPHLPLVFRF